MLHRHEQASADFFGVLKDFHRRRKGAPVFLTEKAAARSRREHEMVVAERFSVEHDLVFIGDQFGDFAEQDLHVWLLSHELPQGCCDVAAGNQSRRDLIKQRLEQVEIAFVDQGDAHL